MMKQPPVMLRITIDPKDNVLVGAAEIMRYLHINGFVTLYRWIEEAGLPCVKRLDGKWMTTMTAIDQWLCLCADAGTEKQRRTATRAINAMNKPPNPKQFEYKNYQELYGDEYNGKKSRDGRLKPVKELDGHRDDLPAEIGAAKDNPHTD